MQNVVQSVSENLVASVDSTEKPAGLIPELAENGRLAEGMCRCDVCHDKIVSHKSRDPTIRCEYTHSIISRFGRQPFQSEQQHQAAPAGMVTVQPQPQPQRRRSISSIQGEAAAVAPRW